MTWLFMTLFILACFFVQITMLNMLIAIMSDTFTKVYEKKHIKLTKTKLEFVSDKPLNTRTEPNTQQDQVFLFVVTPLYEEEAPSDPIEY